jgi:hypothetical protein
LKSHCYAKIIIVKRSFLISTYKVTIKISNYKVVQINFRNFGTLHEISFRQNSIFLRKSYQTNKLMIFVFYSVRRIQDPKFQKEIFPIKASFPNLKHLEYSNSDDTESAIIFLELKRFCPLHYFYMLVIYFEAPPLYV